MGLNADVFGVAQHVRQVGVDGGADRRDAGAITERAVQVRGPVGRDALQHGPEQAGLGAEMVGDQSAAITRLLADGYQRRALDAHRVQQLDRRLDHARLGPRRALRQG